MNAIVFYQEPVRPFKRIKKVVFYPLLISTAVSIIASPLTIFYVVVIMLLAFLVLGFHVLIEVLKADYDGWRLYKDRLKLFRLNILNTEQEVVLYLKNIDEIVYSNSFGQEGGLSIYSKGNKYEFMAYMDAFQLAPTLKYFKQIGINVKVEQFDHELILFLEDKIASFPMNNI